MRQHSMQLGLSLAVTAIIVSLGIALVHGSSSSVYAAEQPEAPENGHATAAPPEDLRLLSRASGPVPLLGSADMMKLDDRVIPAGTYFSLRDWVQGESQERASLERWTHAAALLYEAALHAGFEPMERTIAMRLPSGIKPGFDVALSDARHDLKLYNANAFDVWVAVRKHGEDVDIRMQGQAPKEWRAPVIEAETESFQPETLVLRDYGKGKPYRAKPSSDGLLVKLYRFEQGERKLLYKDFYVPSPRVQIVAPSPPSSQSISENTAVIDFSEAAQ